VEDDGIGIAEEDISKVFDRFYRAERSRTKNGTGLGLAITKEIAEFHQGSISVESRFGEGSTFSLAFSKI
jgi:sensory box histidine kinase